MLRIAPDAVSYSQFSIDPLPQLEDGDITDWVLEPNGHIYALARRVLKYSDVTVPIEFGDTFIVHWDPSGKLVNQVRLALDANGFSPTGLALLAGGDYLIVGYTRIGDKIRVLAQSFGVNGGLMNKLDLGHDGTKASKGRTVRSKRVYHPMAVKANGLIYVLRGTTTEPVYVFSETGSLEGTLLLKYPGLEFDSPHIFKNDLIVHAHRPIADNAPTFTFRSGPGRVDYPVFDLHTGEVVQEYYWNEETIGLVCYTRDVLTFIGQDVSSTPTVWAIFFAKPGRPMKQNDSRAKKVQNSRVLVANWPRNQEPVATPPHSR